VHCKMRRRCWQLGILSQPARQTDRMCYSTCAYGRRILLLCGVGRLTTRRRNVYDVFNRATRPAIRRVLSAAPRDCAFPSQSPRQSVSALHSVSAGCRSQRLTSFITAPCCSFTPAVLLNYRLGPTEERERRLLYRGRSTTCVSCCNRDQRSIRRSCLLTACCL